MFSYDGRRENFIWELIDQGDLLSQQTLPEISSLPKSVERKNRMSC